MWSRSRPQGRIADAVIVINGAGPGELIPWARIHVRFEHHEPDEMQMNALFWDSRDALLTVEEVVGKTLNEVADLIEKKATEHHREEQLKADEAVEAYYEMLAKLASINESRRAELEEDMEPPCLIDSGMNARVIPVTSNLRFFATRSS